MCAEYYPAWFDTWGQAHHPPKNDRAFFGPIDWMFAHGVSFSLYMAHGGTSFGGWSGCRNPFVPNVTSYDYEAPINENGRANPSFAKYRARAARYLNAGETIPEPPADIPTKAYGTVAMERIAPLDVLVRREVKMERPEFMERLGQGWCSRPQTSRNKAAHLPLEGEPSEAPADCRGGDGAHQLFIGDGGPEGHERTRPPRQE